MKHSAFLAGAVCLLTWASSIACTAWDSQQAADWRFCSNACQDELGSYYYSEGFQCVDRPDLTEIGLVMQRFCSCSCATSVR